MRPSVRAVVAWSPVWRWELAPPNAAPALHVAPRLSRLRLRASLRLWPCWTGTRWPLSGIDRITTPRGRNRRPPSAPGRESVVGGRNIQRPQMPSRIAIAPGDSWWDTESDTVIAWGSHQLRDFMRGMVPPRRVWKGRCEALGCRANGGRSARQLDALRRPVFPSSSRS